MRNEEKYKIIMRCLDKWMTNHEKGKWINEYLKVNKLTRIGVYGYGMLGKHLIWELKEKGSNITWVMDRKIIGAGIGCQLIQPDKADYKNDVDLAIITALADVEEIESFLLGFVTGKIISIDELVNSVHTWGDQT